MINTKNYFSQAQNIDWSSMPEALAKGHKLVEGSAQGNWAAYNSNENIKRVVEAYFQKLSDYLEKNPASVKQEKRAPSKSKPETKSSPAAQPKAKKKNYAGLKVEIRPFSKSSSKFIVWDVVTDQKFANEKFDSVEDAEAFIEENEMELVRTVTNEEEPEETEADLVERIDTDVQFIKRYANMHGKVKTQAQILNLLSGLQRAILERRIRKDSPFAKEIGLMQDQLIKAYEKMGDMAEIKIDAKNLKRYLEIANSQESMLSIALLKAYVGLNGKVGIKEKAERLMNRMKKAVTGGKISRNDKYAKKLNDAYENLKSFVEGGASTLSIAKAELNGLLGIVGEDLFSQKKSLNRTGEEEDYGDETIVVPSGELLGMEFQTIGLKGKYKELMGDPSVGFSAMVYGLPKSGKSTLCLDFAKYLAEHHGKVLFCAVEEGFGYTLKDKIERLNASHPNLYITDRVPQDVSMYQFVFIDSVSKAGIDIPDIELLRKQHPETSFIFIYHTTKEGRFKGTNTHAHEVDVIIEVAKGEVKATGRFNAGGRMSLGEANQDSEFDVKKFTAFIAFNDELRNLYYDMTEAKGIYSTWDVYHIQEGTELPTNDEIEVMREIFENRILGTKHMAKYEAAARDFRKNVKKRG